MTREEVLEDLRIRFREEIIDFFDKSPKRVYIEIKPEAIVRVAGYIFNDLEARFNTASGLDARRQLEIIYHFTLQDINLVISLRVKLKKPKPEIVSLVPLMKAANWIEREMHELLGINFKGHPELNKLLLPDDWPDGVYPLRCDYKEWDKDAIRDRGV